MSGHIENMIKDEIAFCEENGCIKNEHGQFIYISQDRHQSLNLSFILRDYKEWLIENKKI